MSFERHNPGEPLSPTHPFLAMADSQVKEVVEELQRRRAPLLPSQPTTTAPPIRTGVVRSAGDATSVKNGLDLSTETIEVWELLTQGQLDIYEENQGYDLEKPLYFTAPVHDDTAVYAAGELAVFNGALYRADSANGPGAFTGVGWTFLTAEQVQFANTNISASPYNDSQWDAASGDRFVDKERATVSLVNEFDKEAPPQGALVKWLGDKLIGFSCEAQRGWN